MMKKVLLLIAGMIAGAALTGCLGTKPNQTIPPRWLDSLRALGTAEDVAVTVGADGMKHFLWSEHYTTAEVTAYYLVYTHSMTGEVEGRTIIEGEDQSEKYSAPDIAVTDGGEVYIVWHADLGDGIHKDCFSKLAPLACIYLQEGANYSTAQSRPRVVAYEDIVFAVFDQVIVGNNVLYYRQLKPLDASKGRASPTTNCTNASHNFDLEISKHWHPDDAFYLLNVAFTCDNGMYVVYGNTNGVTGDITNFRRPLSTGILNMTPALEIASYPRKAYMAYASWTAVPAETDRLMLQYCDIPTCSAFTAVDLVNTSTQNWTLVTNVDMDTNDEALRIAFRGFFESTIKPEGSNPLVSPEPDIWTTLFELGSSVPAPFQVTNTPGEEETDPHVVFVGNDFAIGWRMFTDMSVAQDVYLYDTAHGTRKIFDDPSSSPNYDYDMESRGNYAGGIWISSVSEAGYVKKPWISLNAFLNILPMILR
jgi:hypothetical protein